MERELFARIRTALRLLGQRRINRRYSYTDAAIVAVYFWAVIHDRPICWACRRENWPKGLWRGPLPSQSNTSRRLRTPQVERLIARLEHLTLRKGRTPSLAYVMDGKGLPIARHSGDRQAGFGRASMGKAKGYKLHLLTDLNGTVWGWRVTPMNGDERTMARRLLRDVPHEGYLLADKNYDSNRLFQQAADRGIQLVAPRRYGSDRALGHRRHAPARLRCKDLLECDLTQFGRALYAERRSIERFFGTLSSFGAGLSCLPAWVRTHRRVKRWIQAKLILNDLRATTRNRTAIGA